jgi:hypothetical protein
VRCTLGIILHEPTNINGALHPGDHFARPTNISGALHLVIKLRCTYKY